MRTIARFQVPEEAHLFRLFLETHGIPAYVWDENVVQIVWHYSDAIGGVRVVVEDLDCDEAIREYSEYTGALSADPSPVTVARAWPLTLLLSLLIGAPALFFGRRRVEDAQRNSG
jgi:hypothetical protein